MGPFTYKAVSPLASNVRLQSNVGDVVGTGVLGDVVGWGVVGDIVGGAGVGDSEHKSG